MNALALLLSLAGAPAAPVAAPPAAEPAASALIRFIAAGGYCMNVDAQSPRTVGFPACALQLDGGAFWAYVKYRRPMIGRVDPIELVLMREIAAIRLGPSPSGGPDVWANEGVRVVTDVSGVVLDAVIVRPRVCASHQACPDTSSFIVLETAEPGGGTRRVLVGQYPGALDAVQARKALETAAMAARAKLGP